MKHALYEITKNIPPPVICHRSKNNSIAHLVRSMHRGNSALVLFKQVQAAKQAARLAGIKLVWQRVGKGKTARIWHMGKDDSVKPIDSTDTKPAVRVKRKYTKRDPRWQTGGMRVMKSAIMAKARKFKRRHAKLSAKMPRAVGPLFTGPEFRPE